MKQTPRFALILLVVIWTETQVLATIGAAEWSLNTPGGCTIAHVDPYKENHGTCLMEGERGSHERRIIVSHIEWWQIYRGYIAGKCRKGYFLFKEGSPKAAIYKTIGELKRSPSIAMAGKPLSKKMTPQDGWREAWVPLLQDRIEKMKETGEWNTLSEELKEKLLEWSGGNE